MQLLYCLCLERIRQTHRNLRMASSRLRFKLDFCRRTSDRGPFLPFDEPEEVSMKAAVVNELGKAPCYQDFREPVAGEGEVLITVRAAGLHPVVKALASGSHY